MYPVRGTLVPSARHKITPSAEPAIMCPMASTAPFTTLSGASVSMKMRAWSLHDRPLSMIHVFMGQPRSCPLWLAPLFNCQCLLTVLVQLHGITQGFCRHRLPSRRGRGCRCSHQEHAPPQARVAQTSLRGAFRRPLPPAMRVRYRPMDALWAVHLPWQSRCTRALPIPRDSALPGAAPAEGSAPCWLCSSPVRGATNVQALQPHAASRSQAVPHTPVRRNLRPGTPNP